ncbi:MAG: hypothetical protein RR384_02845 [Acidaminococcaceae bacterium]
MKKTSLVVLVMFAAMLLCSSLAFAGTAATSPGVKVEAVRFANEVMTLEYPQVREMADATAQHKINGAILKEVNRFVAEYQKDLTNKSVKLTTSFQVRCNLDGIFSVTLLEEGMYERAAHGFRALQGLTFGATGEAITAQSITTLDKAAKETDQMLPLYANAALYRAQEAGEIVLFPEFKGVTDSVTNFYLDQETKVWAIFQPYEVGPYSSGIITVCLE